MFNAFKPPSELFQCPVSWSHACTIVSSSREREDAVHEVRLHGKASSMHKECSQQRQQGLARGMSAAAAARYNSSSWSWLYCGKSESAPRRKSLIESHQGCYSRLYARANDTIDSTSAIRLDYRACDNDHFAISVIFEADLLTVPIQLPNEPDRCFHSRNELH